MILDISHNAVIKAPPTVIDSLKHSISLLQLKIDSLQKVTERAEIGKEFFSDTISTNLYMFATIIGLAALISWGVIGGMLYLHKKKIRDETKHSINLLNHEFTTKTEELNDVLKNTNYDVNRAMFFSVSRDNDYSNEIGWAMSSLQAYIYKTDHPENKYLQEHFDTISLWLSQIERICKNLTTGDPVVKGNKDNLHLYLNYLTGNIDDLVILERLKNIETDLNHIIYSKPEPPENIMEGEPEAGPTLDINHEVLPSVLDTTLSPTEI